MTKTMSEENLTFGDKKINKIYLFKINNQLIKMK